MAGIVAGSCKKDCRQRELAAVLCSTRDRRVRWAEQRALSPARRAAHGCGASNRSAGLHGACGSRATGWAFRPRFVLAPLNARHRRSVPRRSGYSLPSAGRRGGHRVNCTPAPPRRHPGAGLKDEGGRRWLVQTMSGSTDFASLSGKPRGSPEPSSRRRPGSTPVSACAPRAEPRGTVERHHDRRTH